MSTHVIRKAAPGDLDALVALEEATFESDRISRRQWQRHIGSATVEVLVASLAGIVAAAAVVLYRRGSPAARLYSLAVRHTHRGLGLGHGLLAAVEAAARERGCTQLRLEVRVDNTAALALYARHGYTRQRRLAGFYEDGSDAWRCVKDLAAVTR